MSAPIPGVSKGSRRAANALHKGMHDDLLGCGKTLEQVAAALVKEHSGATLSGVKACLQAKLTEGRLTVDSQGALSRVRRRAGSALMAVPA